MGLSCRVEVEPGRTALGDRRLLLSIDTDIPHAREVDYESVVDRTMARGVVTPTPHCDPEAVDLAKRKRRRHVVDVNATGDRGRPPIDQQVEAETCSLVLAVAFDKHVARQRITELLHGFNHRT